MFAGTAQEIETQIAAMAKSGVHGMIILNDTFFVEQLRHIAAQALRNKLPSIIAIREYAAAGGLMSYGANLTDNFRRAATYVDKILKGAKAGTLPFQSPTRYYLEINGKTAKALGLTIPRTVLISTEKVIE